MYEGTVSFFFWKLLKYINIRDNITNWDIFTYEICSKVTVIISFNVLFKLNFVDY